jgi:hypothetical protein
MNLRNVSDLTDAHFHRGASPSLIESLEGSHGVFLPPEHREVLQHSNGAEVYGGYMRLFGIDTKETIDSVVWNDPDCWKFSWAKKCSNYWCFGETVWGDQYAYARESLNGCVSAEVYFLDALSMKPRIIALSFTDFIENYFIRAAIEPDDVKTKQARHQIGPIEVTSHLIFIPSVLLGGTEDISHAHKMNARSAMICNGDVAIQLDSGPPDGVVTAVEPYEDEYRRMRLRLIWAT